VFGLVFDFAIHPLSSVKTQHRSVLAVVRCGERLGTRLPVCVHLFFRPVYFPQGLRADPIHTGHNTPRRAEISAAKQPPVRGPFSFNPPEFPPHPPFLPPRRTGAPWPLAGGGDRHPPVEGFSLPVDSGPALHSHGSPLLPPPPFLPRLFGIHLFKVHFASGQGATATPGAESATRGSPQGPS